MESNKNMVKWITILDSLETICNRSLRFEIDIRYLSKWIELYPMCFPTFMLNLNSFEIKFDNVELEYYFIQK